MLSTIQIGPHAVPWLSLCSDIQSEDTIHFSGANGFPVGSYTHFLQQFTEQYNICAMDCRATWPNQNMPPKDFSIDRFADDLISALEQQYDRPVIGMGHSMGGLVTVIAAHKRPELFSRLVLLEPASLPNAWIDHLYARLPRFILHALFPFIRGSAARRKNWPSKEAFIERYSKYATFKRFTSQALQQYAEYGLNETQAGNFELVFRPAWEAHIFRTIEYMWKFLAQVSQPCVLIRAEYSNLYSQPQFDKANMGLPLHITPLIMKGAHHLFPSEQPLAAHRIIDTWLTETT